MSDEGGAGASAPAAEPLTEPERPFYRRLSRRVRTLVVSGLLFAVLFLLTMTLPVPYVVLSPGPTCNTLSDCPAVNYSQQIIKIYGHRTKKTTGNLNLTTVSYSTNKLTVYTALRAWLDSSEEVVPRSAIFPPGESTSQVNTQNSQQFSQSQSSAVQAALCELGYPKAFGVLSVSMHGPSDGRLRVGDVLVSVAGHPTGSYSALKSVLQREQPGTSVPVVVKRAGKRRTVDVTLGTPPKTSDGKPGAGGSLGITVPDQPECLAPFRIDLGLSDQIGGPSAGMMFALGIIDKVGPTDLTHGRFVAGTGTIDPSGNVGPIGGIQLKMIAARDAGATIFLAPADNCTDVRGAIPAGLNVVKVQTLKGAITALQRSAAGKSVPHC